MPRPLIILCESITSVLESDSGMPDKLFLTIVCTLMLTLSQPRSYHPDPTSAVLGIFISA